MALETVPRFLRRRDFLAWLLAGALASPALAQKRPAISILHSGYPRRTPIDRLFEALRKLGYEDGRTASVELLGGEGDPARLEALVAKLIAHPPDVIIALTSPAVLALKHAGVKTAVVFAFVPDPVALGVVESLAHPGGTFTGVTYSEAALGGKRLELLSAVIPRARRIAVIWSPSFIENAAILDAIRRSASLRGIELFSRVLRGPPDLSNAFDEAARNGAQGVIFMTDNLMFGHRKEVAAAALAHRLPSIHSFEPEARDGGLMSFGPDVNESYRRAAALADQVLKGTRPADLPVEEPTQFTLSINLKTAKALGLTVPQSLMLQADEVIE
jgi:putative tryptophan/tyrosine transport system substrate-binding protein